MPHVPGSVSGPLFRNWWCSFTWPHYDRIYISHSVCVRAFGSAGCLDTGSAFCWWSLAWWLLPRTENDDWCLWFLWIIASSLYMYAWFGLIWCFRSRSRKHWTSFQRSCHRGVSLLICHWHHAGALFMFALMVAISTLNVVYTQSFGFNLGGASLISL